MKEYKLGEIEMKFADIIWENEPLTSANLVKLSKEKLDWSKSTTYTILRRISERGIFKNENGMVSSVITKDEFLYFQSENFIKDTFQGSLPKFLATFSKRKKMSDKDLKELQKFIDKHSNK